MKTDVQKLFLNAFWAFRMATWLKFDCVPSSIWVYAVYMIEFTVKKNNYKIDGCWEALFETTLQTMWYAGSFGLRLSLFENMLLICQTQPKDAARRYHSSKESYIFLSNHFLLFKHMLTARLPTPFSPWYGCHGLKDFTNQSSKWPGCNHFAEILPVDTIIAVSNQICKMEDPRSREISSVKAMCQKNTWIMMVNIGSLEILLLRTELQETKSTTQISMVSNLRVTKNQDRSTFESWCQI